VGGASTTSQLALAISKRWFYRSSRRTDIGQAAEWIRTRSVQGCRVGTAKCAWRWDASHYHSCARSRPIGDRPRLAQQCLANIQLFTGHCCQGHRRGYAVEDASVPCSVILPARAKLRSSPPAGEAWQYELKFDGYSVQLHKGGASTAIYSRNGGDLSRRFPRIAAAVLGRPAKSCIIDDELIAAGVHGEPIFSHCCTDGHVPTCVYAFDLLELQGRRSS
jgi:hypothetical protein